MSGQSQVNPSSSTVPPSSTMNDGTYNPSYDSSYDATQDPTSQYYIDMGHTARTREQARNNAEQSADAQEAKDGDTGFLGGILDEWMRQGRVDTEYNQELNSQARQLAQGVQTRQAPPMACANYMS